MLNEHLPNRRAMVVFAGILLITASVVIFVPNDNIVIDNTNVSNSPAMIDRFAVGVIAKAKKAILDEPKVKDVAFSPLKDDVEWNVGVLPDGTSRIGYAQYICLVLEQNGAIDRDVDVRIVDITKVAKGIDFRSASLGHVRCSDGTTIVP